MKISMKIGPQKTDPKGFQGFGMKIGGGSSSSAPGRPGLNVPVAAGSSRSTAAAKAKAMSGGASALFRAALDDDDDESKKQSAVPSWSKPTLEARKAQRDAETLLAADATVFQYDEVIDDVKRDLDIELPQQHVRTAVLEQKKRTGLVLPSDRGSAAAPPTAGDERRAKYIEKVMVATDRRKVEQQIVEDRMLKKEQDAREGREVFVTGAFKEELKRRKKFEDELENQELLDQSRDAAKQENGAGFADFHRRLLNTGLASARGGEKVMDRAAPRADLPSDEPVKKEEEVEEDVKKEEKEATATKTEEVEKSAEGHGVQDVQVAEMDLGTKAAKAEAEQAERAEKAMSAKERFLKRKREAAEAAAA